MSQLAFGRQRQSRRLGGRAVPAFSKCPDRKCRHRGRHATRARAKQSALAGTGELPAVDASALWSWYFEDRLRTTIPDDISGYAAQLGFSDEAAFRRAVAVEHWFARQR